MKKKSTTVIVMAAAGTIFPFYSMADGLANDIGGLQGTLDHIYTEMLPMCSQLVGVGRGIAGFAALWYIAVRVYRQIASAEPIDFYPLLRPFALGMAILLFPTVISVINGVMQPTVSGTAAMVQNSDAAIARLLKAKEDAEKKTAAYQMYVGADGAGDREKWYKYTHPDQSEGILDKIGNNVQFGMAKMSYNFRYSVKAWMSEVLQVLYEAAALCINTIRTFYLIVLAILGPVVFGLSVFDGFQHTLSSWLARYINVFLWLPVSNIFGAIIGKVQENMLKLDISQVQSSGDTFFSSTDTAYLIFLLIGIVGYFTVPTVAGYIVHAGGGNGLLNKVTGLSSGAVSGVSNYAGSSAKDGAAEMGNRASETLGNMASFPRDVAAGYRGGGSNSHEESKLKGKS